jgi:hypothetical protein
LDDLYTEAHISDNPNDYNGANIQSYLRNEFNDKVYRDSLSRDFLFIITDGYQYVKGQSGGLNDWDIAGDLTDIETMVLEMDPNKSRPQENNLMTSKWDGWLSKMNAESINLQPKGSLRMIKETIDDFVGNKGIINNSGAVSEPKDQGYKEEEEEKSLESNPATSELELSEMSYFVNDEEGNISDDLPYDEPAKPKPTSRSITNTSSSTTSTGFVPQNQVLSAITTSIDNSSSSIRVDSDGDGVPDNLDNCTTRVGEATNNGCPVLQISATRTAIYRDMDAMPYEIERSSTLQSSDEYSWEVNRGGEIEGSKSQRCYVNFPAIGNYVVKCKLKGKDGYSDEIYLNQHVGIRYAELEGLFNQIAQYGNIAILGGNSEPVQKAKNEANSSISSIKAMISPSGCELLKERKSKSANTFFGDDLNSLFNMLQMAKSDPKLEIRDVSINHVGYDRSNGLIDEIRYSIL